MSRLILLASVPLATGLVARTAAPVRPPTSLKVRRTTKPRPRRARRRRGAPNTEAANVRR